MARGALFLERLTLNTAQTGRIDLLTIFINKTPCVFTPHRPSWKLVFVSRFSCASMFQIANLPARETWRAVNFYDFTLSIVPNRLTIKLFSFTPAYVLHPSGQKWFFNLLMRWLVICRKESNARGHCVIHVKRLHDAHKFQKRARIIWKVLCNMYQVWWRVIRIVQKVQLVSRSRRERRARQQAVVKGCRSHRAVAHRLHSIIIIIKATPRWTGIECVSLARRMHANAVWYGDATFRTNYITPCVVLDAVQLLFGVFIVGFGSSLI